MTAACLTASGIAAAATGADPFGDVHVGRQPDGSVVVSTNQRITPAGTQIEFSGRPAAVAMRPGGGTAALLSGQGAPVVIVDPASGRIVQQLRVSGANGSYDGIVYSADGRELFASDANGSILRMAVADDGTVALTTRIELPAVNDDPYPGGLALSADGKRLYVALSRDNALGVVDLATNTLTQRIPVGNAPHAVVVDGDRAYVSNQGGRRATASDFTVDSSGTPIVADRETGAPVSGTVSEVDLAKGETTAEIPVGLQPTALALRGGELLVANTSSDTVSIVDRDQRREVGSFSVSPLPGAPQGAAPNALALLDDNTLAVSLGRANAIALYRFDGPRTATRFDGLLPTAWYPGGIAVDPAGRRLVVANTKGPGSVGASGPVKAVKPDQLGSASVIPFPSGDDVAKGTRQVAANNGWDGIGAAGRQPRRNARPVPVPERIGEPSTIRHVFYIVKENRTYDQVLGDIGRGNSDPSLVEFGRAVTPNHHALATEFPLLDNFYVSGTNSADGHQWVTQADAPDYLEKAFRSFVRSYPFSGGDAMAYQRGGFLWDDALRHGRSVRAYGEYANELRGAPGADFGKWADWYRDAQALRDGRDGDLHAPLGTFTTHSDVPSLDRILNRDFPRYEQTIPDQYRTEIFLREFRRYVRDGNLPSLVTMTLPKDHTTGGDVDFPTPEAEVADNDLALGRIVEAISHSPYWKDSAIFVMEDDAQAGTDHIDGHRSPGFVISPWVNRGQLDSHYSTQLNMVRTIEQILGLPPMNQMDLAAQPMRWLFTDRPDLTPYVARPNEVPLDAGVAPAQPAPAAQAARAAAAPASRAARLRRQWQAAVARMGFGRKGFVPDSAPEMTLNHATWYATKGYATPYPGERRVLSPAQVRARYDEATTPGRERDGR